MTIGVNSKNEKLMMFQPNALIRWDCKDQWETMQGLIKEVSKHLWMTSGSY
jgi:hypothetical protein